MVGVRLRQLREAMGLTQREMAARYELSLSAWQFLEAEKHSPNGRVFERLCRDGVNVNWVLCGRGEMFQKGTDEPAATMEVRPDPLNLMRMREATMTALDLEKLLTPASMSHVLNEWHINNAVVRYHPGSCTLAQIQEDLKDEHIFLTETDLLRLIEMLKQRGKVIEIPGEPTQYCSTGEHSSTVAKDISGHAALVLMAMRVLSMEVYPHLGPDPGGSKLTGARLSTSRAKFGMRFPALKAEFQKWQRSIEDVDGDLDIGAFIVVGITERKKG